MEGHDPADPNRTPEDDAQERWEQRFENLLNTYDGRAFLYQLIHGECGATKTTDSLNGTEVNRAEGRRAMGLFLLDIAKRRCLELWHIAEIEERDRQSAAVRAEAGEGQP